MNFAGIFPNDVPILVEDENDRKQLLKDFHDNPLVGHQGTKRMANKMSLEYKWPSIRKDISNYVRSYQICQKTKPRSRHKHPMQITSDSKDHIRLLKQLLGQIHR